MPTFEKKSLYHSDLVKQSDYGALTIAVTGDPRLGRNKQDEIIPIQVFEGDDQPPSEHWLQIENPDVRHALTSVPQNTWLYAQAAGSRATAALMLTDDSGPVNAAMPPTPVAGPGAPPAAIQQPWALGGQPGPVEAAFQQEARARAPLPPNPTPSDALDRLADEYFACLEAAVRANEMFREKHGYEPSDELRRSATTLFIQTH